jgi:hypothetical protein
VVIDSITDNGDGTLTAAISFTSHQAGSDSVDDSTCNNWQQTFPPVTPGIQYVIGPPASGGTTYTEC